jgi:small subunit ribosomal protein S2
MIKQLYTIKQLGGHLGSYRVKPWMFQYILGYKNRFSIINLEESLKLLKKALYLLYRITQKNGKILFVNTEPKYSKLIEILAKKSNNYFINEKWIGGFLTNWSHIKFSVGSYNKFEKYFLQFMQQNDIIFPKYLKAQKRFEGVQSMKTLPDVIVLFQSSNHEAITHEARLLKIPTITFVDTNAPEVHGDFVVPINEKSSLVMHYLCNLILRVLKK